jgi:hypothetical protein
MTVHIADGYEHDSDSLQIRIQANAKIGEHTFTCPCGSVEFHFSQTWGAYICRHCDAYYKVTAFEDRLY